MKQLTNIVLLTALLFYGQMAKAQTITNGQLNSLADTAIKRALGKYVDTLQRRAFASVVTGQTDLPSLTSFAAFTPTDGKFTFNGGKFFTIKVHNNDTNERKPLACGVSITASGALMDGNIAPLFGDGQLNANTDINLRLHFRLRARPRWELADQRNATNKSRRIILDNIFKMRSALKAVDSIPFELGKIAYQDTLSQLRYNKLLEERTSFLTWKDTCGANIKCALQLSDSAMAAMNTDTAFAKKMREAFMKKQLKMVDSQAYLASEMNAELEKQQWLSFTRDSLLTIQMVNTIDFDHLDVTTGLLALEYGLHGKLNYKDSLQNFIRAQQDAKIYELIKSLGKGITLHWLNAVIGWNRTTFRTYDKNLPFTEQIKKDDMSALKLGAEFNMYNYDSVFRYCQYFNIGLIYKQGNNLSDLSTSKVKDETITEADNVRRTTAKEYTVYTDPVRSLNVWNPYAHYYRMYGENLSRGYHLFANADIRDDSKSIINAGAGVILGLYSKDKRVLNTELFVSYNDIGRATIEDNSAVWKQFHIGLSFAVPFLIFKN